MKIKKKRCPESYAVRRANPRNQKICILALIRRQNFIPRTQEGEAGMSMGVRDQPLYIVSSRIAILKPCLKMIEFQRYISHVQAHVLKYPKKLVIVPVTQVTLEDQPLISIRARYQIEGPMFMFHKNHTMPLLASSFSCMWEKCFLEKNRG